MQTSKHARIQHYAGISLDDERRRRAFAFLGIIGALSAGRRQSEPKTRGATATVRWRATRLRLPAGWPRLPRIASPTANGGAVAPGLALFVFIPFWFPMQQVAAGPSNTCELRPLGDNTRSANSIAVGSSFQITDHAHHIMRSMPSR